LQTQRSAAPRAPQPSDAAVGRLSLGAREALLGRLWSACSGARYTARTVVAWL